MAYQPISTQPTGIRKANEYITGRSSLRELQQWAGEYLATKATHNTDPSGIVAAMIAKLTRDLMDDVQGRLGELVADPARAEAITERWATDVNRMTAALVR